MENLDHDEFIKILEEIRGVRLVLWQKEFIKKILKEREFIELKYGYKREERNE